MAGFFDTLFSGGAEREAANRNRQAIAGYTGDANGLFDSGLGRSVGAVTGARDTAGGLLDQNSGLWSDYFNKGSAALDKGTAGSMDALRSAGAAYDPLASLGQKYGGASSLLLDSLGVNGAGGNSRATDAFHAGPGYEFKLGQGLDAINRRRAAGGMLNSGNADIDAITYGTGLADQTYGDWQTRLGSFTPYELSATSGAAGGKAGVFGNMANLIGQDTASRLGLLNNSTAGQTGVNTQKASNDIALGNTLGNLYTGDASNRVGVAGNALSGNVSANNMQAQGEAGGARNVMGAVTAAAQMAMGMPPTALGGMGGGGGGSSGGSFGFGGSGGGGGGFFSSLFPSGGGTGYATNPWSNSGAFAGGPPGASAGYGGILNYGPGY